MKLYTKKEENGKIIFEEIKKICGRSIDEVMTILEGLNMEEEYDMKLTIKNLIRYQDILEQELQKSISETIEKVLKDEE